MRYPDEPGFKRAGTSSDAAAAVKKRAEIVGEKVLRALTHKPMTADECAGFIDEDILTVRPRISEHFKKGKILDTGLRRPSSRGRLSTVWEAL